MIGIRRNTGFSGILSQMKIYVDGHEVAKIKENQQLELELPTEKATISVSQFGAQSNELVVLDGQVIEITNSSWLSYFYLFIFMATFFITFLLPQTYQLSGFLTIIMIAILFTYFKNTFELKVIYP